MKSSRRSSLAACPKAKTQPKNDRFGTCSYAYVCLNEFRTVPKSAQQVFRGINFDFFTQFCNLAGAL